MKYQLIKEHCSLYAVEKMCKLLEVSKSGYQKWLTRGPSKRQREDEKLVRHIISIFLLNRRVYGSPRITGALRLLGHRVNKKRVERLMRENNIIAGLKAAFKPKTTDSNHKLPISPNRLKELGQPRKKNQVWVSDITYILVGGSWSYLCMVMDLFTREIVGYTLATHMKTSMVIETLHKAVLRHRPSPGLMFHSDRGVQYASREFRTQLKLHGFQQSMSAKGYCYDNAAAESFFKSLKYEEVNLNSYANHEIADARLFDYIEVFYNRQRLHSSLGMISPAQFAERNTA